VKKNLLIKVGILLLLTSVSISQTFKERAIEAGINHKTVDELIMAGGVAVIDYNNDGFEDLYLIGGGLWESDKLYRNNGDGSFTNVFAQSNIDFQPFTQTNGVAAADLDNDGLQDLVISTNPDHPIYVFKNLGNGKFYNIGFDAGISGDKFGSASISIADINNDGLLDIYVANHRNFRVTNCGKNVCCDGNSLFINQGDWTFKDMSGNYNARDMGCGLAAAMTDFDNDGDLDIFLANDWGRTTKEPNKLYRNEFPTKVFSEIGAQSGVGAEMWGMGVAIGDYNEDGFLDYYVTNIGENHFYKNNGDTTFTEIAQSKGVDNTWLDEATNKKSVSWSTFFFDYDNDTELDLFVANGFVDMSQGTLEAHDPDKLFKNSNRGEKFDDVTETEGLGNVLKSRGAAYFDYDNDGDLDIIVAVVNGNNSSFAFDSGNERFMLYENQTTGKNWLKIKLEGTRSNRDGIGARVVAYFGNRKMMRESGAIGATYMSNPTKIIHFGMNNVARLDSLVVIWPGDRNDKQVFKNVNANQLIEAVQPFKSIENLEICYGGEYEGVQYFETTSFVKNLTATYKNADSIVTVNISVLPEIRTEGELFVCFGDYFDERQIFEDITVEQTLKAANGCDSMFVANIKVNMPYQMSVDTSMCLGSRFNGRVYTNDTTFVETLIAENGCDSVVNVSITVFPAPFTESNATICYGEEFEGKQYFIDEVLAYTFPAETGCDSVHTVNLTVIRPAIFETNVRVEVDTEFEGKIITKDEVITKTIPNGAASGCDSIVVFNVEAIPNSVELDYYSSLVNFRALPNPMSINAQIYFTVPESQMVNLSIYDVTGIKVSDIHNGFLKSGEYKFDWNGKNQADEPLSPGMYLINLNLEKASSTFKLMLEK